jgi:hypothetical protein
VFSPFAVASAGGQGTKQQTIKEVKTPLFLLSTSCAEFLLALKLTESEKEPK